MPTIRWRRLDLPGTDEAKLHSRPTGHEVTGHATFRDPDGLVDLRYAVQTDATWRTRTTTVEGSTPVGPVHFRIRASEEAEWWLNERPTPAVHGCIDLDLAFTPATNLLSLRRLQLPIGGKAEVVAAWLAFPALELHPLTQIYERRDSLRYLYTCPALQFVTLLEVTAEGFPHSYPPLWEQV